MHLSAKGDGNPVTEGASDKGETATVWQYAESARVALIGPKTCRLGYSLFAISQIENPSSVSLVLSETVVPTT